MSQMYQMLTVVLGTLNLIHCQFQSGSHYKCSCHIVMVDRCQVFNLLDKENDLSAKALVDGLTRSNITTRDIFGIILVSIGKLLKCLSISSKHTASTFFKVVHQEKIYKNHKEIKIPKILLSKPEFNVDFKSVLIFATLFILFTTLFILFATLFILFATMFIHFATLFILFATLFILFATMFILFATLFILFATLFILFATLFILFEILAFKCTKVSQKILRTAILDFSVCLPFQDKIYFILDKRTN